MGYTDIRAFCRRVYQDTIAKHENTELKRALKTHERVPAFIDNLARELGGLTFDVKPATIEMCVRDMTNLFIRCVETGSKERLMSDLEKLRIKQREAEAEEFRKEAAELEAASEEYVAQDKAGNETSTSATKI